MSLQLPIPVKVFFMIEGALVDVTSYVLGIEGVRAIIIEWGYRDGSDALMPSTARFTLNDPDGALDWENPYSVYYGRYGKGAQVWIEIDDGVTATLVRLIGQLTTFNARWRATAGADTTVEVVVTSLRRRDSQYVRPVRSPAYRALTTTAALASMLVYLPLEETSGSTILSSPVDDHPAVAWSGSVSFGAYTGHPATPRMVTLGQGILFVVAPPHTAGTEYRISALWHIPAAGTGGDNHSYRVYFTGGTLDFADIIVTDAFLMQMIGYRNGVAVETSIAPDYLDELSGTDVAVAIDFVQNGADIEASLTIYTDSSFGSQVSTSLTDTWPARTFGALHSVAVQGQFSGAEWSIGHLAITTSLTALDDLLETQAGGSRAWRGYEREAATWRIRRLATETGLGHTFRDGATAGLINAVNGPALGPQASDTLDQLFAEAIEVDGGLLGETRTSATPGPFIAQWQGLVNQPPKFTLTYGTADGAQVGTGSEDMRTADDDFAMASSIVMTRRDGATVELTSTDDDGLHWTADDPADNPRGIGDRPAGPFEVNLYEDDQLPGTAGWRLHMASWRGRRYPQLVIDLTRSTLSTDNALIQAVRSAYLGDVAVVQMPTTAAPKWADPLELRLMIMGGIEEIGQLGHTFRFATRPADAWEVEGMDTSGSTLFHPRDTDDTGFRFTTTLGPQWSTTTPYFLQVSGEVVRLDSLSDQTITYIAAGAASSGNNANTTPGLPAGITVDSGELLVLISAIRSSGTGTPDTPAGWTVLADAGNVKVMARPYSTGVVAPTCTYTGGAAGDDTWSRIFAWDNASTAAAGGTKLVPAHATQLNASAQDIAYPALAVTRDGALIIYVGWKQDDWTSVATLAGATEVSDSPLTAGNDMGIVVDYAIQTTATDIAAGSFTVTGGASAISRGIVVALRPTQLGSVTRAMNNVSISPAEGATVRAWRPGVEGL